MNTIQQITAHKWVGNAHADMDAFNRIHAFVTDRRHTVAARAEALRIMSDKGMGCGRDEHLSDAVIIAEYVNAA